MKIQLVDGKHRCYLLPLTYTRPVAELRCGIITIAEKYTKRGHEVGYDTEAYLNAKYPSIQAEVLVSGSVCPTDAFLEAVAGRTFDFSEHLGLAVVCDSDSGRYL